jgi:hypothetical protein
MFTGDSWDSWAVYEDDDSALIPLLVVRQLVGAHRFDERNLPSIAAIAPVEGLLRRDVVALASEWEHWWITNTVEEFDGTPRHRGPGAPSGTHLRAFLDRRWEMVLELTEDFRRAARSSSWIGEEADLTITSLMNEMEAHRGATSRPFRLRLEVLPFIGPGIWPVTPTRYLVSSELRRDASAFGGAIQPVLEGLAWGSR